MQIYQINAKKKLLLSTKKNILIKFSEKIVEFNSMTEETKKSLKPAGSRLDVIYSSCKIYRWSKDNYNHFDQLSILKPMATNEFTEKDCFDFYEDIVDLKLDFCIDNFHVDYLLLTYLYRRPLKFWYMNVSNWWWAHRLPLCLHMLLYV